MTLRSQTAGKEHLSEIFYDQKIKAISLTRQDVCMGVYMYTRLLMIVHIQR